MSKMCLPCTLTSMQYHYMYGRVWSTLSISTKFCAPISEWKPRTMLSRQVYFKYPFTQYFGDLSLASFYSKLVAKSNYDFMIHQSTMTDFILKSIAASGTHGNKKDLGTIDYSVISRMSPFGSPEQNSF